MQDSADGRKERGWNPEEVLESVSAALAALRFGAIQLTIHEGRVVQLDVTERQRFPL